MDIDDILDSVSAPIQIPQQTLDHHALVRLWVAERSAPEILPWDESLMDRVMERIRKQVEHVEAETGNEDPKANFRLIIVQTDLERWKWLVRCYLRARLAKIDRFAIFVLSETQIRARLSPAEIGYAQAHQQLLEEHYQASFLRSFPERLRGLEDTAGGINMVDKWDADDVVWVRILNDGVDGVEGFTGEMEKGGIYVCRWSSIGGRVFAGDVEVI
ncbi:MAG: GINS complex subunit [Vezdaea aestivalis]|nr:MAG: GINS complex subunit [Vezdaea aestivalis]